jgi:hypothetical protein
MMVCRALLAVAIVVATAHYAGAQFGGMPGMPGGPGGPGFGGSPSAPPARCVALKAQLDELQKRGQAIGAANERKANVKVACQLFRNFIAAANKAVKILDADGAACGAPAQVKQQVRETQVNAQKIGQQVCDAAARGPAAAGPTVSEALGTAPVLPDTTERKGAGTFETLTGNPFRR